MVSGNARPLSLKFVPVTATRRMVTLAGPWLVRIRLCWLVEPTTALPNATLVRLALMLEAAMVVWGELKIVNRSAGTHRSPAAHLGPTTVAVPGSELKRNENRKPDRRNFMD